MAHIFKNKNLEVHIDLPNENYRLSRFDWTGKITAVKYQGKYLTTTEIANSEEGSFCGKGLYNEFGIDTPVGYQEAQPGEWFPKIGVGLLRKEEGSYNFQHLYEIKPSDFKVIGGADKIQITCSSHLFNGYAYVLEKEIRLLESGFEIKYRLKNTGQKTISTNEYNHNFLAIDRAQIDSDYILKFPFQIQPKLFGEYVNPEQMVDIRQKEIGFKGTPSKPFFFSNISGGGTVDAKWALENSKSKIGISETGSFQTKAVNVWGWGHVVSPELFYPILLQPGQTDEWSRTYAVYELT
jgi:hypothetical protein